MTWLADGKQGAAAARFDSYERTVGSKRADAVRIGFLSESGDGHGHGWLDRMMFYGGERARNMVICGPNRSGKGSRLLIPNLLWMENRSIFVMDPKGELAAVTARYRRSLGEVVVINPFNMLVKEGFPDLASAGFNPLAHIDPESENFNADVALLAEALIMTESTKDPHWDDSAREIVAGLMMLEVAQAHALGEVPSLANVRTRLAERLVDPKREE